MYNLEGDMMDVTYEMVNLECKELAREEKYQQSYRVNYYV